MNVTVPIASEKKANKPISKQLLDIIERDPKVFEGLSFGEIRIEIKNSVVYRILLSNSILVKPNEEKS